MRSALWGIVVASSTLAGGFALSAGCGALPTECTERFNCPPGATGGANPTTTSTSTSSGTGGGPPATCVPGAGKDPVEDPCGVFVSSSLGDDKAGVGSKGKPYKTLAAAISAAAKSMKPVYACAETFPEALIVSEGVGLYGGLDCKQAWKYTGAAKSTLTADADAVPLTLSKTAGNVSLFDFKVQAVDAVISGGSSIAVIADQVTAAFERCDLIAGNGANGTAGTTPTDSVGPTSTFDNAIRGNDGQNACTSMAVTQLGGAGKDNAFCPTANGGPFGGTGGNGEVTVGDNGNAPVATAQTALGGTGQPNIDPSWDCSTGAGHTGTKGMSGTDGVGAKELGVITASGYGGVAGGDGVAGKPGQGGGGGGGAKGKALCSGASGGSGGAGGCGGHGGSGGTAGGASVALVSLGATLSLDAVTIQLGTGGDGGSGAFGQGGGVGGSGGLAGAGDVTAPPTSSACKGGDGGPGGLGGHGGGGRGGHAIGIAASGKVAPNIKGVAFAQKGTVGLGGKGGASQDGDSGVLADVQLFP